MFGGLILGGDCVGVKLGEPADVGAAKVGAVADIVNVSPGIKMLHYGTEIHRGGKPLDKKEESINIASGQTYNLNDTQSREHGDYDVSIIINDITNGTSTPLAERNISISISKPPTVVVNKVKRTLKAELDTKGISNLQDAKLYAVLSSGYKEVAGQTYTLNKDTEKANINLSLAKVKPGKYTLSIIIYGTAKRLFEYSKEIDW